MKPTLNMNAIADLAEISDGFHTFTELYEHRCTLWIALCRFTKRERLRHVWRSKLHSDGSGYEGWFLLGMHTRKGEQITYHLPMKDWPRTSFATTLERAPEFDGHTSQDVLDRLEALL